VTSGQLVENAIIEVKNYKVSDLRGKR